MPATRFKGPVQTGGAPTGLSAHAERVHTIPAIKRVPISADGKVLFVLPDVEAIIRAWVNTETAWEGSAGTTTTFRLGTSADDDRFGSVVLSGVGTRDVALSAAVFDLSAAQQYVVDVTTVGTAGVGAGSFYVEYLQAQVP
jgi:hypothetical protein